MLRLFNGLIHLKGLDVPMWEGWCDLQKLTVTFQKIMSLCWFINNALSVWPEKKIKNFKNFKNFKKFPKSSDVQKLPNFLLLPTVLQSKIHKIGDFGFKKSSKFEENSQDQYISLVPQTNHSVALFYHRNITINRFCVTRPLHIFGEICSR